MHHKSLFRTLLVLLVVLTIVSIIASLKLESTLPTELQDYLSKVANEEINGFESFLILISAWIALLLLLISTLGLWFFMSWGRTLYIFITLAFLPFYLLCGPIISTGWEVLFSDISLMLEGLILAMMFSGATGEEFRKKEIVDK